MSMSFEYSDWEYSDWEQFFEYSDWEQFWIKWHPIHGADMCDRLLALESCFEKKTILT